MKRAIGFHLGLRGDLVMSTVAARSFKEQHPGAHLTLGVGPQFYDLLPLFYDHENYDATHVYSTYDEWPGPKDIEYLTAAHYDIVFHGKPEHRDQKWWLHRHQYAETAHMCGLPIPKDIQPRLYRWFALPTGFEKCVAFAPFGGNGGVNDKMLSMAQAQAIVDHLIDRGYSVLHLGAPMESRPEGVRWLETDYFASVRNMLSCCLLIHCDTGMGHVAGAYNQKSLGIYAYRYFGQQWAHQIRPIHSNFHFVEAPTIPEISLDNLFQTIDNALPHE